MKQGLLLIIILLGAIVANAQQTTFTPICVGNADTDKARIQAIITATGTNDITIRLPYKANPTQRCTVKSLTIPSRVTLDNTDGSSIAVVSQHTLTVQGPRINPPGKVMFFGPGTTVIAAGSLEFASTALVTTSAPGLAPTLPNDPSLYLNGVGGYSAPAGGGGGGGGITSLGTPAQTGATQTFGNSTNITWGSATNVHTATLVGPIADGLLSNNVALRSADNAFIGINRFFGDPTTGNPIRLVSNENAATITLVIPPGLTGYRLMFPPAPQVLNTSGVMIAASTVANETRLSFGVTPVNLGGTNKQSLGTGSLLIGGPSAVGEIAPGAANRVLMSDGSAWGAAQIPLAAVASSSLLGTGSKLATADSLTNGKCVEVDGTGKLVTAASNAPCGSGGGGGGGTVVSVSNVGSGGVGLSLGVSGSDAPLKNIRAASPKALITNNVPLSTVDVDVASGSPTQAGALKISDAGDTALSQSDTRVLTQAENDAAQGTSGSPSSSNKYVTDADPRASSATGVRVVYALKEIGATLGAKIQAAENDLGASPGEIIAEVNGAQHIDTQVGIGVNAAHTLRLIGSGTISSTNSGAGNAYLVLYSGSALICDSPALILEEPSGASNFEIVRAASVVANDNYRTSDVTIQGCHAKGLKRAGDSMQQMFSLGNCVNCKVEDNVFEDSSAIALQLGGASGGTINLAITNIAASGDTNTQSLITTSFAHHYAPGDRVLIQGVTTPVDINSYREVSDGVTNSTTTFTSATLNCNTNCVGQRIYLSKGSPFLNLVTTIAGYTNATTVTLADNPGVTTTGVTTRVSATSGASWVVHSVPSNNTFTVEYAPVNAGTCSSCTGTATLINESRDSTIVNNRFVNNSFVDIAVVNGKRITITGNVMGQRACASAPYIDIEPNTMKDLAEGLIIGHNSIDARSSSCTAPTAIAGINLGGGAALPENIIIDSNQIIGSTLGAGPYASSGGLSQGWQLQDGIYVYQGRDIQITNNHFKGYYGYAIEVGGQSQSERLKIANNKFMGPGSGGGLLRLVKTRYSEIANNTYEWHDWNGNNASQPVAVITEETGSGYNQYFNNSGITTYTIDATSKLWSKSDLANGLMFSNGFSSGITPGRVGIGTTTPNVLTELLKSDTQTVVGGSTAALRVTNSSNGAQATSEIQFGGQTNKLGAAIAYIHNDGSNNTNGDLTFATRNATTDVNLTRRMSIGSTGNVGIGTVSPQSLLQTSGQVTIDPTGAYNVANFAATSAAVNIVGDIGLPCVNGINSGVHVVFRQNDGEPGGCGPSPTGFIGPYYGAIDSGNSRSKHGNLEVANFLVQDFATIANGAANGAVTAATNASPVQFTITSPPAGFVTGNNWTVQGATGGWTAINGSFPITVIDSTHFTIPVNSTSFGALAGTVKACYVCSANISVSRIFELEFSTQNPTIDDPYLGIDFPNGTHGRMNGLEVQSGLGQGQTSNAIDQRPTTSLLIADEGVAVGTGYSQTWPKKGIQIQEILNSGIVFHYRSAANYGAFADLDTPFKIAMIDVDSPTANIIKGESGWTVTNGIDLSALTVTTSAFKSPGFNVNGSGQITTGAITVVEGLLARVAGVDLNTATPTTLYTASQNTVITKVVLRGASTLLTTASISFGWNSAAYNDVIADSGYSELAANPKYRILTPMVGAKTGAAGLTFKVLANTLQGSAATVVIDVFGYQF